VERVSVRQLCNKEGESVQAFLLGKGVQSESLDTKAFKIAEQMRSFVEGVAR
jgi:hypothetical protein